MAFHTVRNPLLLPELFYCILDYIDEPESDERRNYCININEVSREARQTFFALARTCRATSEASLDRLWRSLDSLVPLIRSFATSANVQRAKTPPSSDEWAILLRYAVRVRELRIFAGQTAILSLYFLECILQQPFLAWTSSPPLCLLPNLRVLIWNPILVNYSFTPFIEPLLAPGLVALDITLKGDVDSPHRLFELFSLLCPNLKALRWKLGRGIYCHEKFMRAADALSRSVRRLSKIEHLRLFVPFDPVTLKQVILSPTFNVLCIMLASFLPEVKQLDVTPADTPFPNVETLKLEIWDFDFLVSLLRPHQQMFRVVWLKFHSGRRRPDAQSVQSFFAALATPQRTNSLQAIDLKATLEFSLEVQDAQSHVLEDAPLRYCLTYETLSPLASFHRLRRLRIRLNNQVSLDDDELTVLARGWPELDTLFLDCRSGGWPWAQAKYPTLTGLLALLRACPELLHLLMPIDARIVPMGADADEVCNAAIEDVAFVDGLISDPRLVADFIRMHLPGVERVDSEREPITWGEQAGYLQECYQMWQEVAEHL